MVLRRRGETANRPENIGDALQTLASEMVDVAIVLQTSLFVVNSPQIAASALEKRLPTVYGYREHVITGGLVSYGVDLRWCYRRAAYFVTKILRGTAPSDLPIEFPTGFWLAANLQTAKSLGHHRPADTSGPRRRSDRMNSRHFWYWHL
jgi:putative ABC transport system substrate-binding protein